MFDYTLTLVASTVPLTIAHIASVQGVLDDMSIRFTTRPVWLSDHRAVDIAIDDYPRVDQMAKIRDVLAADKIDALVVANATRAKKLFLADMDSTILTGETLDELARHVGIGDKIAAITARAMRGEIDFRASCVERLALMRGTPATLVETVWREQTFSPGAKTVVQTLRARGCLCVLVSGGFDYFTSRVGAALGFHHTHGTALGIADGVLTGEIVEPLLDSSAKLHFLNNYCEQLRITSQWVAAIGDGANDVPMLGAAGLGVGYHPKPLLRETLTNQILYGDLTALLYAFGINESEFITDDGRPEIQNI